MGASMAQTPLPPDQSPATSRAPSSAQPAGDTSDSQLDSDVPVTKDDEPSAAPSSSAAATMAPHKRPAPPSPKPAATKPHATPNSIAAKKRPATAPAKKAPVRSCTATTVKHTVKHAKNCKKRS